MTRTYYNALRSTGALEAMVGERSPGEEIRFRAMPLEVENRTYRANRKFYDAILKSKSNEATAAIKATVILLSGCQDNQLSSDGPYNGLFTANLLRVWNAGKFKGGYKTFWKKIREKLPPTQSPNYFVVGRPNPTFEWQRAFTVG